MLTSVEVRTAQGALLQLPLDDITDGFVVQNITGLDPVKATMVSSGYANEDGEQYHSSKREKRNIVLSLGLEPDYSTGSVRQLRNSLYEFFMPKSEVFLRFISDDEPTVDIAGRVESFEAPLFTQQPTATISILNFDPDFVGDTGTFTGNSTGDLTETKFDYDGTVETGFLFQLQVKRSITQFSILNRPPDGQLRRLDVSMSLVPGDILKISTTPGAKGVYLTRGVYENSSVLYALAPYSDWIQLYPGINNFRVAIPGAAMPYTIDYTNKYGGL